MEHLRRSLEEEEAYIFTDSASFMQEWVAATSKCSSGKHLSALRCILTSYFSVVADAMANRVPKIIVWNVKRTLDAMGPSMRAALAETSDLNGLLFETEQTEELRRRLSLTIHTTEECLGIIEDAMKPRAD